MSDFEPRKTEEIPVPPPYVPEGFTVADIHQIVTQAEMRAVDATQKRENAVRDRIERIKERQAHEFGVDVGIETLAKNIRPELLSMERILTTALEKLEGGYPVKKADLEWVRDFALESVLEGVRQLRIEVAPK